MRVVRRTVLAAIVVLLLLLAACEGASQTPTPTPSPTTLPTPTPSPYEGYLTEEIPPCTPIAGSSVDPCEPNVKVDTTVLGPAGSGGYIFDYDEPFTIRYYLDGSSLVSIPHIVLRGTYVPDTVRCTSGDPYHVPSYVEPGYFQHSIVINCYADVQVSGYILGKGPARLTVLVAFHHYWHGYYAEDAANSDMTEQELVELMRWAHEATLEEGYDPDKGDVPIYGREVVLFVGPGHSHAHEVWEVFRMWGVERREDGTVVIVHPHRDDWKELRPDKYREHLSALEVDLPRFKKEVTAAHQARVAEYNGRITSVDDPDRAEGVELPLLVSDIHDLDEFMESTGAYDHPDGTPVPPPPVPGEGDPVPDIGVDDTTPGPSPVPPGGVEDSTPTPIPAP